MRRQAALELAGSKWRSTPDGDVYFWTSINSDAPIPVDKIRAGEFIDIPGNWAAVVLGENSVTLTVDSSRPISLLYARANAAGDEGHRWVIADTPENLKPYLNRWQADPVQAELFPHLGYAVSEHTLISGVHTVQAGSSVTLDYSADSFDTGERIEFFDVLRFQRDRCDDADAYALRFSTMLDETIGHVVEQARGRQLAVPLSGGIDSRLLLLWLKKLGVANVVAFTYGVPGSPETIVSQGIAEQLGVPWFMVTIDPETLRKAWESSEGDDFIAATWGGTSLPHVQDWYALREISRNGLIDPDAIILPGHTVVGSMHDEDLIGRSATKQQVLHAFHHHHSLQHPPRKSMRNNQAFNDSTDTAFKQVRSVGVDGTDVEVSTSKASSAGAGISDRALQSWIEWYNLRERQAKYINNSMRAYEFFGWDWALPMCTPPARTIWAQGSGRLTLTRDWYRAFTNHEFAKVTSQAVTYHAPTSTSMPAGAKRILLAAMRATRLDRALARVRSVRVMLRHPMGFSGFISDRNTPRVTVKMLAGQTAMGLWASDFLHNRWAGKRPVVPPVN